MTHLPPTKCHPILRGFHAKNNNTSCRVLQQPNWYSGDDHTQRHQPPTLTSHHARTRLIKNDAYGIFLPSLLSLFILAVTTSCVVLNVTHVVLHFRPRRCTLKETKIYTRNANRKEIACHPSYP
jgi:hypothetical protein